MFLQKSIRMGLLMSALILASCVTYYARESLPSPEGDHNPENNITWESSLQPRLIRCPYLGTIILGEYSTQQTMWIYELRRGIHPLFLILSPNSSEKDANSRIVDTIPPYTPPITHQVPALDLIVASIIPPVGFVPTEDSLGNPTTALLMIDSKPKNTDFINPPRTMVSESPTSTLHYHAHGSDYSGAVWVYINGSYEFRPDELLWGLYIFPVAIDIALSPVYAAGGLVVGIFYLLICLSGC